MKFTTIVDLRRAFATIVVNFILLGCAHAKPPRMDEAMSAFLGNDYTALIEACGSQLVPGYTYCRMREGQSTDQVLYFVGPIVKCKRDHCIDFKIFDTKGDVAHGDSIPKGKNRVA